MGHVIPRQTSEREFCAPPCDFAINYARSDSTRSRDSRSAAIFVAYYIVSIFFIIMEYWDSIDVPKNYKKWNELDINKEKKNTIEVNMKRI